MYQMTKTLSILIRVLLVSIVVAGLVPLVVQPRPAAAAETGYWELLLPPKISPPLDRKVDFGGDGIDYYSGEVKETSMTIKVRSSYPTKPDSNESYEFTFDKPPAVLVPGQSYPITVNGRASAGARNIQFYYKDSSQVVNLYVGQNSGLTFSKTVQTIGPTTIGWNVIPTTAISFTADIGYEVQKISWLYALRKGTAPAQPPAAPPAPPPAPAPAQSPPVPLALTLKYYPPFESFVSTTRAEIGPVTNPPIGLVATLQGGAGQEIIFYIDPETPGPNEPGKNLNEVLNIEPNMRPHVIKNEPKGRKYLPWTDKTDAKGEVNANLYFWIDRRKFASELLAQSRKFQENGRVSGTVWAGVYNQETQLLEPLASAPVEFTALALITSISGKGQPDDVERFKDYPGRVRVTRPLSFPILNNWPVPEGFPLMPGDIVSIDGNAAVEIVWATLERIRAEVRGEIELEDTTVEVKHARVVMLSSAYDSGFPTTLEQTDARLFGFGVGKGIDLLVESIPYVGTLLKEGGELVAELQNNVDYKNLGKLEDDFSKMKATTRIRLRSKLLVDNTGNGAKIYNIEGSPDIKTAAGGEVTLTNGKMVTVSDDGQLSSPQTFDVKAIEDKFKALLAAILPGPSKDKSKVPVTRITPLPAKSDSSFINQDVLRLAALLVVALVIFGLRLMTRKKAKSGHG